MNSKKLLLLGCGHMGQAMLQGWLQQKLPNDYTVVDRHYQPQAQQLNKITVCRTLDKLPPDFKADIAVVAIKPAGVVESLPKLKPYLSDKCLLLSVVAGQSIAHIEKALTDAALPIVRAMPNLPAAIGCAITAVYANFSVNQDHKQNVEQLLKAIGQVVWVASEDWLNPITAVSGSGPAYFYALVEALESAAVAQGLPQEVAQILARETFIGSALLLRASNEPASKLRREVTSPGGTTEAALSILMKEEGGLNSLVNRAVDQATKRAFELSAFTSKS